MAYNFLGFAFAFLLGSWIALVVMLVRARREIRRLEASTVLCTAPTISDPSTLRRVGAFVYPEIFGEIVSPTSTTYQNRDGDGVPDVFQRRKPLSEILEFEKPPGNHSNDYWTAIELPPRPPSKGEYYLSPTGVHKAEYDFANYNAVIVKAVPGTNLDDLVDLTK